MGQSFAARFGAAGLAVAGLGAAIAESGAKKRLDNPPSVRCRGGMSSPAKAKFVTPVSLTVDAILVAAFCAYLYTVLRSHVPSDNEFWIRFWAGLTAACMSGVFWLCIQMFRVVLRAQLEARKQR